jgi:hypothetical protein
MAIKRLAAPSFVLGGLTLLVHLAVNNRYALLGDELYFIVCGQHFAFGYVDQPPLMPWIAGASHALFGTAPLPLRLIPALAATATVALTVELARILGGGRFAQWLAGVAAALSGTVLVSGYLLTTDALQPLTWLGCSWCLVRLVQTKNERWWLGFGAIAGLSLLSKYLILFFIAGLAVGIVATPLRRSLLRPWIYIGALIALAFAAPSIIWQATHGWPFLELNANATHGKNLVESPLAFFGQQILFAGPAAALVWLAGLWRWSVAPKMPELRAFSIAYAVMFVLFTTLNGKAYYLTPIYPVLLVAGALACEQWLKGPVLRGAALAIVAVIGLVLAPLALPILPPADYRPYGRALGLHAGAADTENHRTSPLPVHLSGQFGWRDMAGKIAAVYNALPPEERAHAVFYGRDYAEAAAVDLYGPALNGPPAMAAHNNYFLWGPKGDGSVVITLGRDVIPLLVNYRDVSVVGRVDNPYAESWETGLPILVLRHPRVPLAVLWPKLKHYD